MIAIICAMEKELTKILSKLTDVNHKVIGHQVIGHQAINHQAINPLHFWQGFLNGVEVVLSLSGIGKIRAGITTFVAITNFNPRLVISCGVGGGYDRSLKTLDLVIGSQVGFFDVDLQAFGLAFGQMDQYPLFFPTSPKILDLAKNTLDHCRIGTILTSDRFIDDYNAIEPIVKNHYSDQLVLSVDMESASIASVCYDHQVEFLAIRTISDVIGNKQTLEYVEFVDRASSLSADSLSKLITRIDIDNL